MSRNVELEKDNTFLISFPTRPAWFFTGVRVYSEYTAEWYRSYDYPFEKLSQADHVYLAGDAAFVEEQKNRVLELAEQNSYKVNFQLLTTGYRDHVGHGLYQIRLTAGNM